MIRVEETTKKDTFCHLDASSEFHKVVLLSILEKERERDARRRQSILANSPSKGVSVTTSRTLRVLLYRLPVPVIARHTPFPPSLHPPFSRTL